VEVRTRRAVHVRIILLSSHAGWPQTPDRLHPVDNLPWNRACAGPEGRPRSHAAFRSSQ